jgi:hypothetical protein
LSGGLEAAAGARGAGLMRVLQVGKVLGRVLVRAAPVRLVRA